VSARGKLLLDRDQQTHFDSVRAASHARDAERADVVERLRELSIDLADRGHVDLAQQVVALADRVAGLDRVVAK
jgi:hypothetical protein